MERIEYDEFSYFHENAAEFGLTFPRQPTVRRESVEIDKKRTLSSLVWGDGEPELVFLHGGAQNAHTWDTVAMALDRSLVAIDLPGHGHSDEASMRTPFLVSDAFDVAVAVERLARSAVAVIGMSLGGLIALCLSRIRPDLVRRLVLVDVTPGVTSDKARAITAFIDGPKSFSSFEEILARTVEHNPTRSVSSLRRGIMHNALQLEDGSWVWRYARSPRGRRREVIDYAALWEDISHLTAPLMLVRGMSPQSVVDDSDEAELVRRASSARVEHVSGAGHSVQGDRPVELAHLIADFVAPMT